MREILFRGKRTDSGERGVSMNVLVACEESQRVTIEFRKLGHNAFSCDIIDCSGGHPEWHIKQDVLPLLNGNCSFETVNGVIHTIDDKWDMIIAFPPCTYLSNAGARWFNDKYGDIAAERKKLRLQAAEFFLSIIHADCLRIAVENPKGYMNTHFRKPDQIIQPYYFGDPEYKTTCLWLKNLKPLEPTKMLQNPLNSYPTYVSKDGYKKHYGFVLRNPNDSLTRSKTFSGIAKAMAEQWTKED